MEDFGIAKCDGREDDRNHWNFRSGHEWIAATLPGHQVWRLKVQDRTLFFVITDLWKVRVFSSSFRLEPETLDAICAALFRRFPLAAIIEFQALVGYRADEKLSYPHRVKDRQTHYVLALPKTWEEYKKPLDRKFAYYQRRFFRNVPGASFRIVESGKTSDDDIRNIYASAISRRKNKGLASGYSKSSMSGMTRLPKLNLFRLVLSAGEDICAQSIFVKQNNVAHPVSMTQKSEYDTYSPGVLCFYLGIEQLISRGFDELDFSSPYMKYKTDFGATPQDHTTIEVMRTRFHLALRQWRKRDKLRTE